MSTVTNNGDVFDSNRIIFLSGDFKEESAYAVIKKVIEFEAKDPAKDILIYIDSYGGECDSFIAMHEAIKMSRCDVATVCIGKAMSCGQMLLVSGTKGKRFITANSRVLMHPISFFADGNVDQIDIRLEANKKLQDTFERLIAKYTKISKKELREMMSKESYLSAAQCKELGIVDHIITSSREMYKIIGT